MFIGIREEKQLKIMPSFYNLVDEICDKLLGDRPAKQGVKKQETSSQKK